MAVSETYIKELTVSAKQAFRVEAIELTTIVGGGLDQNTATCLTHATNYKDEEDKHQAANS